MDDLDDLRLKIAERYGWVNIKKSPFGEGIFGFLPDGKPSFIPDWTRDIATAWELVEELRVEEGCDIVIEVWDRTPPRTTVRVMVESSNHSPQYHGRGATAPEAICRAWLAWKEAQ